MTDDTKPQVDDGTGLIVTGEDSDGGPAKITVVVDLVDFGNVGLINISNIQAGDSEGEDATITLDAQHLLRLRGAIDEALDALS